MHIGVVAAVHDRPWVTRLFYTAMDRVREQWSPHTTTVFVAGDDEPLDTRLARSHKALAEQVGAHFVEVPNHPIGAKWNAVSLAAFQAGVDRMVWMGSDDILTPAMAERYLGLLDNPHLRYAGLYNSVVVAPFTCQAGLLLNHRAPFRRYEPMGPGRILDRRVLEQLGGLIVHPLKDGPGMDYVFTKRLMSLTEHGNPDIMIGCDDRAMLIDVKTGVNITPFQQLSNSMVYTDLPYRPVVRQLPAVEQDYLSVLGSGVA